MQRALIAYGRLARGMTLGVRAILIKDERVLLVKHTYLPGWYLPGGGVESGESIGEALAREIAEETGATLTGAPQLFGLYRNQQAGSRDHVALFVCRAWTQAQSPRVPDLEIAAVDLFRTDALPSDVTAATRARLAEVLHGAPVSADW